MTMIKASRVSISPYEEMYNVKYGPNGNAYLDPDGWYHQHKTGEEWFNERSQKGYLSFGDRNLGAAVTHKVEVLPGEDYTGFWTRIHAAKKSGEIKVIGSACYSAKDAEILKRELGVEPDRQIMDEGALVGSSYMVDGKAVYPHGKAVNTKDKMKHLPLLVVAVCMAIGYLLFASARRGS